MEKIASLTIKSIIALVIVELIYWSGFAIALKHYWLGIPLGFGGAVALEIVLILKFGKDL